MEILTKRVEPVLIASRVFFLIDLWSLFFQQIWIFYEVIFLMNQLSSLRSGY